MFKNFTLASILSIIIIGLFVGVIFVYADWTAPLSSPPTCVAGNPGCDAPINVGITNQNKTGRLGIGLTGLPVVSLDVLGSGWIKGGFRTDLDTYLAVDSGNVGIGTTSPQAKLEVDGAVILGNTFADQIRMNGKLIYGGMARSYGIFLNGKIYCKSGINFGQYSFECKYPVVDILSPAMESEVPIYMEYNTSPVTVAYQYLNIICSTLGGKYLSHTITGSSVVGNVLRADVNTVVGESVGSKTIGWRSVNNYMSRSGYFRFGNVSCSYDFHY